MPTYLLTWNPAKWPMEEMEAVVAIFRTQGWVSERWSCGGTKRISQGDRVFLLRQGQEPRGIVGAGTITEGSHSGEHWGDPSKTANYVGVVWDFIDTEPLIPRQALDAPELSSVHWNTQSSGIEIPSSAADQLWALWEETSAGEGTSVDEELDSETANRLWEGGIRPVLVNRYERSPLARRRCLERWGVICQVCQDNPEEVYGATGRRIIQVHHKIPLSEIREGYLVDPENDLAPVCPNCHAALHSRRPAYSVEELRALVAGKQGHTA